MIWTDRIEAGNRDYQRELAISLIESMGVERALRACQANGWDGVLVKVLCYRGRPSGSGNPSRKGSLLQGRPVLRPARFVVCRAALVFEGGGAGTPFCAAGSSVGVPPLITLPWAPVSPYHSFVLMVQMRVGSPSVHKL